MYVGFPKLTKQANNTEFVLLVDLSFVWESGCCILIYLYILFATFLFWFSGEVASQEAPASQSEDKENTSKTKKKNGIDSAEEISSVSIVILGGEYLLNLKYMF